MEIDKINKNTPITHETLFGKHDAYAEELKNNTSITNSENDTSNLLNRMKKEIALEDTSFLLPEGKEKIFLALYACLFPYILGFIFLFFYIAEADLNLFSSMLNHHSHFLTWCIGYEILMLMTLSILSVKNLMIMSKKNTNTLKLKTL